MAKLVQVASFMSEIDMTLVRNKLENIGIKTYVRDEHTAALREFSMGGLSGVKLLVSSEDYSQTLNYLVEIGHYNAKDFEASWLEKFLHKIFGRSKT